MYLFVNLKFQVELEAEVIKTKYILAGRNEPNYLQISL